jgi:hypothetical protein
MSQGEVDYTINDSLSQLNDAWRTEANAPEILPYKEELVDEIRKQLEDQQASIDQRIDDAVEQEYFTATLYEMDIERVRYSMARYLRTRILKIEKGLEYILSNIDIIDRLSTEEREFATKLNSLNNSFFEDNVSNRLQDEQSRDVFEMSEDRLKHAQPKMQDFVFCKALDDVQVQLSSDKAVDLMPGVVEIIQYSLIKEYVVDGRIQLL